MTKHIILFWALFCLSIPGFGQNENQIRTAEEGLDQLVSEEQVVGVAAAVVVDDAVQWQGMAGYGDREKGIKFTETTLTRMASVAKPMTAIAIMQLVEKAMIDLDASIVDYLPGFPNYRRITVRQLLSHTSGIPQYKNARETETQKEYDNLTAAAEVFKKRKLRFEPGTSFYYTTYGYVVLGLIIEKVSGLSYETYMQQHIWGPAGMSRTSVEKFSETYENKSQFYHYEKGESRLGEKNNLSNRIPGGGIQTTLLDLIKFGQGVVSHLFISEESLALMTEVQFPEKEGNKYGLGWYLYGPESQENVVIGHGGEQTGAAAQLMLRPDKKTVVAVLSNTSLRWKQIIGYSVKLIETY